LDGLGGVLPGAAAPPRPKVKPDAGEMAASAPLSIAARLRAVSSRRDSAPTALGPSGPSHTTIFPLGSMPA
jgi:hypothetical protein